MQAEMVHNVSTMYIPTHFELVAPIFGMPDGYIFFAKLTFVHWNRQFFTLKGRKMYIGILEDYKIRYSHDQTLGLFTDFLINQLETCFHFDHTQLQILPYEL